MTRIDDMSRLAALAAARLGKSPPQRGLAVGKGASADPGAAPRAGAGAELPHDLLVEVRALVGAEAELPRAAFRVFLRRRLKAEFGTSPARSRALDQTVDQVLAQMEQDEELRASMKKAGQHLVAQSRGLRT